MKIGKPCSSLVANLNAPPPIKLISLKLLILYYNYKTIKKIKTLYLHTYLFGFKDVIGLVGHCWVLQKPLATAKVQVYSKDIQKKISTILQFKGS